MGYFPKVGDPTSEQLSDLGAQQASSKHPQGAPVVYRSNDLHDWCNATCCDLCAVRALVLSTGESRNPQFPFLSPQLTYEDLYHNESFGGGGSAQLSAFHIDNNQGIWILSHIWCNKDATTLM